MGFDGRPNKGGEAATPLRLIPSKENSKKREGSFGEDPQIGEAIMKRAGSIPHYAGEK